MKRPAYYSISALQRDDFTVFFPIGGVKLRGGEVVQGTEVKGYRKTFRRGQPNECAVFRVRRTDGTSEDLPEFMAPTLFRPSISGSTAALNGGTPPPRQALDENVTDGYAGSRWNSIASGASYVRIAAAHRTDTDFDRNESLRRPHSTRHLL